MIVTSRYYIILYNDRIIYIYDCIDDWSCCAPTRSSSSRPAHAVTMTTIITNIYYIVLYNNNHIIYDWSSSSGPAHDARLPVTANIYLYIYIGARRRKASSDCKHHAPRLHHQGRAREAGAACRAHNRRIVYSSQPCAVDIYVVYIYVVCVCVCVCV